MQFVSALSISGTTSIASTTEIRDSLKLLPPQGLTRSMRLSSAGPLIAIPDTVSPILARQFTKAKISACPILVDETDLSQFITTCLGFASAPLSAMQDIFSLCLDVISVCIFYNP